MKLSASFSIFPGPRMGHLIPSLALSAVFLGCWLFISAGLPGRTVSVSSAGIAPTSVTAHSKNQLAIDRLQAILAELSGEPTNETAKGRLVQELLGTPSSNPPLTASALLSQLENEPLGSHSARSLLGGSVLQRTGTPPSSCLHRSEQVSYPWAPLAESPTFEKIAVAYERFHARCTAAGGNVSQLLASETIPPCKYIVYTVSGFADGGLGNQLIGLASTLLYAMLTRRVILIHEKTLPWELLCEPFTGSRWLLPESSMRLSQTTENAADAGKFPCGFVENKTMEGQGVWTGTSRVVYLDMKHCSVGKLVPFSDAALDALEAVNWIAVYSNQFWLPALFHQRRFLPLLREMFPDNRPSARLMRRFFHPNDAVWQQVKRAYAENMAEIGFRIGTQIRYFDHEQPVNVEAALKRLIVCGHTTGKLPRINEVADLQNANALPATGLTNRSILVGTLEAGVKAGVFSTYAMSKGDAVYFHVFDTNNETTHNYGSRNHMEMALVDMWLLSYTQLLIASPWSTFGQVAMALGNMESWVLEREPLNGCSKARSMEPCYQVIPGEYQYGVPAEGDTNERLGFQKSLVGVLSKCHDQENGLTFVTP